MTDDQKLLLVAFMLRGEAKYLWEAVSWGTYYLALI